MTEPDRPRPQPRHADEPLTSAEQAVAELLTAAHLLAAHQLPDLLATHGRQLRVDGATMYLADLQQNVLVPFVGPHGPGVDESVGPLAVDATLAGRAYQHVQVLTQDLPGGQTRIWLPLLNGSERLGVLTAVTDPATVQRPELLARLRQLASLAAELVMSKKRYGDTIVRLRRTRESGLAAEMQWSLLPPLTFACHRVTIAAALEPAYQIGGDTVDYAVDAGFARVGVFDGMGHGLHAAQLAALTVAAYRNARRAGRSLTETARTMDEALLAGFRGEAFTTALLAQLDTDTGRLEWVSAGHPEPLLLRDGRLVKTLHVDPAPPLGLGHSADPTGTSDPVTVGSEQLQPGDRVLFYTDGVTEPAPPTATSSSPSASSTSSAATSPADCRPPSPCAASSALSWPTSKASSPTTPPCSCSSGAAATSEPFCPPTHPDALVSHPTPMRVLMALGLRGPPSRALGATRSTVVHLRHSVRRSRSPSPRV